MKQNIETLVAVGEAAAPESTPLGKPERRHPPEPGAAFNDVEQVILTRRSVRVYRDKPVPEHLVQRVLEAGRFAPSAGNTQPWRFVVIQDPALIQEMTDYLVEKITTIANWVDYTRPGAKAKKWLTRIGMRRRPNEMHPTPLAAFGQIADGRLGIWHGASTVILILSDVRGAGSPMLDAGIVGQNMVLSAHSMGLGTCWVSFAKILETSPKYRKLLGIQHPYKLASSIALGYPRGIPDGYIERETHETLWLDANGEKKVVS